jgi:hypothetical protein
VEGSEVLEAVGTNGWEPPSPCLTQYVYPEGQSGIDSELARPAGGRRWEWRPTPHPRPRPVAPLGAVDRQKACPCPGPRPSEGCALRLATRLPPCTRTPSYTPSNTPSCTPSYTPSRGSVFRPLHLGPPP